MQFLSDIQPVGDPVEQCIVVSRSTTRFAPGLDDGFSAQQSSKSSHRMSDNADDVYFLCNGRVP